MSSVFAQTFRAGPLYDSFELTLNPGTRTEAVGPLIQFETTPDRIQWAIPPLTSSVRYPEVDGQERDFLYPILTYDRYGQEYRWQFIQLISFSGGGTHQDQLVRRSSVFPFYFHQTSPDPSENYTAVFPFYGTLKHRLMRDEVHVVMFPLYVESRKKDVVTDNYLYPFFHLRHGDGLSGWQLWPFVGVEHKQLTTRTNDFGTAETVPGHEKLSILWPIYFNDHTGLGTTNPESFHAVLPFYSSLRSPNRDSTSYGWPFFNFINDRDQKYREWEFPFPFWEIARGEGKTLTRFIPFYSYGHTPTMDSTTVMWPLYNHRLQHSPELIRERTRFGIWLYSRLDQTNVKAGTTTRRTDVWPLFTQNRTADGSTRFQLLAPLEPILPANKNVERNYSPLWSLWRSERNATTGSSSQSFLWNLYRRDVTPETRKVSFLLGLFQYKSTPQEKRWRIFFIPISKKQHNDR